ncbi:ABC transporter ATP-binding protein [Rubinisphaera margarita]|uniref:ABC transporter ATP-binding protein n=1 Tax=Rubinisphaera margarita TaxID=2909586 RepID=UPI001EE793E0|nr:ABC transporter ATP-binding protein [Rubinisphaera margarita]MCG6156921.1 ABC transporter ATP-binding protein [Rubinisphaera margarita]
MTDATPDQEKITDEVPSSATDSTADYPVVVSEEINGQLQGEGEQLAAEEIARDRAGEKPTLEIRNLHRFFGKLKAVNNVSFHTYAGQVMGFIGPNGAGKTTTMRIIATLDLPTAGDAFVCGHSVVDDPEKVRRCLGFMPDSFGKYSNMDVVEYLDFFARAYGFRGDQRRDAIDRVLVFTELRKLADKPIRTLSKGMSQRLGLGRTLIHDPQVLILDEPAAGLDPRARVELRELIHLLATEMHKTVLISSHILTELGEICDSAAIIEAGQILTHGTIEDLKRHRSRKSSESGGTPLAVAVTSRSTDLRNWLLEQPFVSHVAPAAHRIVFEFAGDNTERANLLKRMIEKGFAVTEYAGKSETLEDAFMSITEGIVQ